MCVCVIKLKYNLVAKVGTNALTYNKCDLYSNNSRGKETGAHVLGERLPVAFATRFSTRECGTVCDDHTMLSACVCLRA